MPLIKVECRFEVNVYVPDHWTEEFTKFMIEEHGCPGTGAVGAVVDAQMARAERQGYCWACALKGENKILKRP